MSSAIVSGQLDPESAKDFLTQFPLEEKVMAIRITTVFLIFGLLFGGIRLVHAEVVTTEMMVKAVELKARRLVFIRNAGGRPKEIELEVDKQAKIILEGEEVTFSLIRPGQKASVSFETTLEVVTKIVIPPDSGKPEGKPKMENGRFEPLNLEKLNTNGWEIGHWVSPDALEIYWATSPNVGVGDSVFSVWMARRTDSSKGFNEKKMLFLGHSPVLSSDCLDLYVRDPNSEMISRTTRKNRKEDFVNPQPVRGLSFPGMDPSPRWLSFDGLILYLDMKDEDERYYTWEVERSKSSEEWGNPKRSAVNIKGFPKNFRFVQVSATPDDKSVLCMAEFPGSVTKISILSRIARDLPFSEWREIPLQDKNGKPQICFKPQFVSSTRELYFNSGGFFQNQGLANKLKQDIWVIKDFDILVGK